MNIVFYPRFERGYKRLDPQIRRIAHERIALFEQDPFDRRLRTHELNGTSGAFQSMRGFGYCLSFSHATRI